MAITAPHLQNYNLSLYYDEAQTLFEGFLGLQRLLIFPLLPPGYFEDHVQSLVEWSTEN